MPVAIAVFAVAPLAAALPSDAALAETETAEMAARTPRVKACPGAEARNAARRTALDVRGEHDAAAREALLDCILGYIERSGDGGDGFRFAVEKDHRFAVILRQSLERAPEHRLLLARDGVLVRGDFRGMRVFIQGLGAGGHRPATPADGVLGEVPGDAAKPAFALGRVVQVAELAPGGEEGLLGDFLAEV